jgi:hypothetical protein
MAGRKLSDLTTTTSLSDNDLVYVVDVSAATGSKSKGIAKSDLAALMGTTAAATQPVETEYADITALLADQGNQTTGFLQYVVDASADPNIASGEAYYEKLATSTATLADDYRLLSDTEVTVITDSNSYRVFRIQDIQDEATPLTSVSGGKVSFEYNGANVTAILFNKLYTDAIAEFYGKDVNVRFYNRTTKRYETEAVASTAWTTVNTDYYRAEVTGTNIQIADLSANNRVEFFIVEAAAGGGGGTATSVADTGTVIDLSNPLGTSSNMATPNTNTTFTTTGAVQGGWNQVKINTTSEPTVTGATKEIGAEWVTSTVMYLNVSYNGSEVVYFFSNYIVNTETIDIVEDTTPQLGGELDTNGHSVGGDPQTATGDGTTTIDWKLGNTFNFQFGAFNETFTFTAPTKAGVFILKLVQDSVGSRTATFPASVKWTSGTAPTLTTTATTGTDIITFYYDGTSYFAVQSLDFS